MPKRVQGAAVRVARSGSVEAEGRSSLPDGHAETTMPALSVEIPIRTVSETNQREHWAQKHRRKRWQQFMTKVVLRRMAKKPKSVIQVRLTRLAPRRLDTDNGVGALKHVQDALAEWLGINDGDVRVRWFYGQEKSKAYAVRIEVW